jgi:hypothetical protein
VREPGQVDRESSVQVTLVRPSLTLSTRWRLQPEYLARERIGLCSLVDTKK